MAWKNWKGSCWPVLSSWTFSESFILICLAELIWPEFLYWMSRSFKEDSTPVNSIVLIITCSIEFNQHMVMQLFENLGGISFLTSFDIDPSWVTPISSDVMRLDDSSRFRALFFNSSSILFLILNISFWVKSNSFSDAVYFMNISMYTPQSWPFVCFGILLFVNMEYFFSAG